MASLHELLERVEKATGPDRELDCLLWAEFDNRDVRYEHNKLLARSRRPPHDECWLGTIDPGRVQRNFSATTGFKPPIPAPTASIDAALALVERKLSGRTYLIDSAERLVELYPPEWPREKNYGAQHPHIPLAIITALLRALSNPSPQEGL